MDIGVYYTLYVPLELRLNISTRRFATSKRNIWLYEWLNSLWGPPPPQRESAKEWGKNKKKNKIM